MGFDRWVGKMPWRTAWQPTPYSCLGESYGQRSLAGYSPWGCRVGHDSATKPPPPLKAAEVWRDVRSCEQKLEVVPTHLLKPSLTPKGLEELAALPHYIWQGWKSTFPTFPLLVGLGKRLRFLPLLRVRQLLMIWSRAQWGSWPQSLSVSLISLTTRNKLHSASLTFPEFQLTDSSSY